MTTTEFYILRISMMSTGREILTRVFIMIALFSFSSTARAYEIAVSLGSTAPHSATIAMGDRSKWPTVADMSWGVLANLAPIGLLTREQQEAVFNNFKERRAIAELPYRSIRWDSAQPDIAFIESFGFNVPYIFVLDGTAGNSMLTRGELLKVRNRFPDKKIIMNTHTWVEDHAHVETIKDIVDGICIEYFPHNARFNIAKHVAPFAEWAYNNGKILIFLMPPLPDEDDFVYWVTQLAQIVYDENKGKLPHGWMKSDRFIFSPANYTFGASSLPYVSEDSANSVLAAAKQLLLMRPQLDAALEEPKPNTEGACKGDSGTFSANKSNAGGIDEGGGGGGGCFITTTIHNAN